VPGHGISERVAECTVSAAPQAGQQVSGDAHENDHNKSVGSCGSGPRAAAFTGQCDFCQARDRQEGCDDSASSVTGHGAGVASVAPALRGPT